MSRRGTIQLGFTIKILGALIGCAGFIMSVNSGMNTLTTALIGIGTILIAAGVEYGG